MTIDQKDSRQSADRLGELFELLGGVDTVVPFERTVGDEAQGVIVDPEALIDATLAVLRDGGWHIGIGIGSIEGGLPASSREGRGEAFLRARTAVTEAKKHPVSLAVRGGGEHGADLESVLRVLGRLWGYRTGAQWEAVDLLAAGNSGKVAAEKLGISPPAFYQRKRAAAWEENEAVRVSLVRMARRAGKETA